MITITFFLPTFVSSSMSSCSFKCQLPGLWPCSIAEVITRTKEEEHQEEIAGAGRGNTGSKAQHPEQHIFSGIRQFLYCQPWKVRTQIISRKINPKLLDADDFQETPSHPRLTRALFRGFLPRRDLGSRFQGLSSGSRTQSPGPESLP